MLTGKQRSYLRSEANKIEAVLNIGKNGLTPEVTASVDEALERRELIKIAVLNNCAEEPRDIANALSGRTRSDVVTVIGRKIVLYRQNRSKPVFDLTGKGR